MLETQPIKRLTAPLSEQIYNLKRYGHRFVPNGRSQPPRPFPKMVTASAGEIDTWNKELVALRNLRAFRRWDELTKLRGAPRA